MASMSPFRNGWKLEIQNLREALVKPRSRTTHRASGLAQGGVHAMGFTGGFLFRVHQKIIVFEIHVKSTNDGEQVSLKITWIYNDFYNDLTGIGSPQFFFFRKECPSKSPKILDWISVARKVEKLHSNPPASTSPSVTKEVSLSERLGSPEKAHSGKIEDLIRMNGW